MPIYAYRCAACGHAKDVLQKLSDAPLTVCPVCGEPRFEKQVTAAGFQLKGSGWYVTDFRSNNNGQGTKSDAKTESKEEAKGDAKPDTKTQTKTEGATSTAAPAPAPAAPAAAPPPSTGSSS